MTPGQRIEQFRTIAYMLRQSLSSPLAPAARELLSAAAQDLDAILLDDLVATNSGRLGGNIIPWRPRHAKR